MSSTIWILASVCLIIVQAQRDVYGPQTFNTNPLELLNRGYVIKDVSSYLSPSQVKALEANQRENESSQKSIASEDTQQELQKLEAEIKKHLERLNLYINDPKQIPATSIESRAPVPAPVKEPRNENPQKYSLAYQQPWRFIPTIQKQQNYFRPSPVINLQEPIAKLPENNSFMRIFADQKVEETQKLQQQNQESPDLSKLFAAQRDSLRGKELKLIPYEYLKDNTPGAPKLDELEALSKLLSELNLEEIPRKPETIVTPTPTENQKRVEGEIKEIEPIKYGSSYDASQHAPEYHKFVMRIELENALARVEALRKITAASGRKEVPKPRSSSEYKNDNPFVSSGKSLSFQQIWRQ